MRSERKARLRGIAIAAAIVLAAGFCVWEIRRVLSPRHLVDRMTLKELLDRNKLADLTYATDPQFGGQRVNRFTAEGPDGRMWVVVRATGDLGDGMWSPDWLFVFDEKGTCVAWSKNAQEFFHGGLFDVTRDGFPEWIVAGGETPSLPVGSPDEWPSAFRVFRLRGGSAQLLLDVRHKSLTPAAWPPGKQPSSHLWLERAREAVVTFTWSEEEDRFTWEGRASYDWRVVFPKPASEPDG